MDKTASKTAKQKIFDIKHLPMDIGRLVYIILQFFFGIKRIYAPKVTSKHIKGKAIIAANHTSFADPMLLGSCFWYRRVFFLVAEVVMKNKVIAFLLKGMGCVKIDRNICDVNSVRKIISLLNEGHTVTIFPQGGIDRSTDISTIKSGVILMAMRSHSPIVPVYIHKRKSFFGRNYIVIGEPVNLFPEGEAPQLTKIDEYAELIHEKMEECKEIFKAYGGNK